MKTKQMMLALCMTGAALTTAWADGVKYTINGKTPADRDGETVYLLIDSYRTPKDSAKIVNGMFTFTGEADGENIAILQSHNAPEKVSLFSDVGIEATPVTVDFTNPTRPVLKGGALNARVGEYQDSMLVVTDKMQKEYHLGDLSAEFRKPETTEARKQEIRNVYNQANAEREAVQKSLLAKNLDNVLGAYLLLGLRNSFSDEEVEATVRKAGPAFQAYAPLKGMMAQIDAAKVRRPGNKLIDSEQPDKDGNLHKLSDYIGKGKYVLLDFWASWCGPCRAEVPNVKAAYEKFHDKGFEIVGVSLDNKKEAWLKAIDQLGMPWIHLSDLQGWKNATAKQYGVNSIPCTLLFGPDGTIIGADYRGNQLEKKLEELIK